MKNCKSENIYLDFKNKYKVKYNNQFDINIITKDVNDKIGIITHAFHFLKEFLYIKSLTSWWSNLFVISLFLPWLRNTVFVLGTVVNSCWYGTILFDYILYNKFFDILYVLVPHYDKTLAHILDIIIHVGILLISYFISTEITLYDIIFSWCYFRLWCLVQSNFKQIYYRCNYCKIYKNKNAAKLLSIIYFIETIVLFVHFLKIIFLNTDIKYG